MLDVLFFLFITIFFIYKLKNSFGIRKHNDADLRDKTMQDFLKQKMSEKNNSSNNTKIVDTNEVIDMTDKFNTKNKPELNIDFELPNNVLEALTKVGFKQDTFLKGVEQDIEMINEAFSDKDLNSLNKLLSETVYEKFKKQIEAISAKNEVIKSYLISVLTKKIENIFAKENNLFIEVYIETEQINFIENDKQEVVFGDKKRINKIKEKWVFSRNINSRINFWIVEEILSIE